MANPPHSQAYTISIIHFRVLHRGGVHIILQVVFRHCKEHWINMKLQDYVLKTWSMSIKNFRPQFHIEDAIIWNCVQLKKVGTYNKVPHPRITLWFENLCKWCERVSISIFKKWGRLNRKCVMNQTFGAWLCEEEIFIWSCVELRQSNIASPSTEQKCNFWRFHTKDADKYTQ
jgi:hypothetical protein